MKGEGRLSGIVDALLERLPGGIFTRRVALLATGTAAGQALVLFASPVLTRLYTPDHFGVLAAYIGILGTISAIGALKYEVAIPLPGRNGTAANVLAVGVIAVALICLTAVVGLWVARLMLGEGWQWEGLSLSVLGWLLPLGLIGNGTYELCKYWAIRYKRYDDIARTKISRSTGRVTVQIGFGLAEYAPIGLLLGHFAGQSSGVGSFLKEMWHRDRDVLSGAISLKRMWIVARRYWRFPAYSAGAGLILNAGLHVTPLLLVGLFGSQVAGWFTLADRVTKGPASLVGQAVAQVYFGEIASFSDDPRRMQDLMMKIAGRLALIVIGPSILIAIFGEQLFSFVFGTEWTTAGTYAQFLAVVLFFNFVTSPVSQHLNVLERQDLMMLWSVIRFTVVVAALTIPWWVGLGDSWAIIFYSIGSSLCYVALFFINSYAIKARLASGSSEVG